jgi:hypothetical protein
MLEYLVIFHWRNDSYYTAMHPVHRRYVFYEYLNKTFFVLNCSLCPKIRGENLLAKRYHAHLANLLHCGIRAFICQAE